MDINKLGTLLYGVAPFTNLYKDSTILIGEFVGYNYMIPIPYSHIRRARDLGMNNDKLTRICDEYIKTSGDYNFYIVNLGGVVLTANIQDKFKLYTRSSYENNIYSYSLIDKDGYKYFVVKNEDEEIVNISLENKTIKYLVDEINKKASLGLIDIYATEDDCLELAINLIPQTDVYFTTDLDSNIGYMEKVDILMSYLTSANIKHLGFIDGDFLTPYVSDDEVKEYKYTELAYFCELLSESGRHITATIPFSGNINNQQEFEDKINEALTFHEEYLTSENRYLSPYISVVASQINLKDDSTDYYNSNCTALYTGLLKSAHLNNYHIKCFLEISSGDSYSLNDDYIKRLSSRGFIPITRDRFYINIHSGYNLLKTDHVDVFYKDIVNTETMNLLSYNSNILLIQDILRSLTSHFDSFLESSADVLFKKHPIGAKPEIARHVEEILSSFISSIDNYVITIDHVLDDTFSVVDYKIDIELFIASEVNSISISTTVM